MKTKILHAVMTIALIASAIVLTALLTVKVMESRSVTSSSIESVTIVEPEDETISVSVDTADISLDIVKNIKDAVEVADLAIEHLDGVIIDDEMIDFVREEDIDKELVGTWNTFIDVMEMRGDLKAIISDYEQMMHNDYIFYFIIDEMYFKVNITKDPFLFEIYDKKGCLIMQNTSFDYAPIQHCVTWHTTSQNEILNDIGMRIVDRHNTRTIELDDAVGMTEDVARGMYKFYETDVTEMLSDRVTAILDTMPDGQVYDILFHLSLDLAGDLTSIKLNNQETVYMHYGDRIQRCLVLDYNDATHVLFTNDGYTIDFTVEINGN